MGPDDAPEERMASKNEMDSLHLPAQTKPNPRPDIPDTNQVAYEDDGISQMLKELAEEEDMPAEYRALADDAARAAAERQQQLEEEASQLPQRLPDESIKDYLERTEPGRADDDTQLTQTIKGASKRKRFGLF